jgi:hypothetical protein
MDIPIVTELTPYLDAFIEVDPKESRFVPDSLTPRLPLEPNMFYRHDHTTIEVRTVEGCKNTIVGTFTTRDFQKRTGISVCIFTIILSKLESFN